MVEIQSKAKPGESRCPYCRDDLSTDDYLECSACKARYHNDCVKRCVNLGCQGELKTLAGKTPTSQIQAVNPLQTPVTTEPSKQSFASAFSLMLPAVAMLGVVLLMTIPGPGKSVAAIVGGLIVVLYFTAIAWDHQSSIPTSSNTTQNNSTTTQARENPETDTPEPSKDDVHATPTITPEASNDSGDPQSPITTQRERQGPPGLGKTS